MSGHRVHVEGRSSAPRYLALLVIVAAIGGLAPTVVLSPHSGVDSHDDLAPASVAPRTFRQGGAGPFSETEDTYLSSAAPDTNFGAHAALYVDASGCTSSPGSVCKALIKFPDFIGPDSGQVPAGSTIASASLDIVITNRGLTQDVYQVTQSWNEATATWNGFSPAGSPATKPRESVISPTTLGLFSINITSIVQRWVDGEANEGILLASTHSDGVDYESSESANPPALTVQFVPPSEEPRHPSIVDLGTLPGDSSSYATAVNDEGQIVGVSCCSDGTRGFLWEEGVMIDLGRGFGGTRTEPMDMNDYGQIVGWSDDDEGRPHAFLWEDGVMNDLLASPSDPAGGFDTTAFGINDEGQVVGGSRGGPFLWDDGAVTYLGQPEEDSWATARAINNEGQIVVESGSGLGEKVFLWQAGAYRGVGNGSDDHPDRSKAINDAGQVVGWSGTRFTAAWIWKDGVLTNLEPLPRAYSHPFAINEAGDAVGGDWTSDPNDPEARYVAVLWKDGALTPCGGSVCMPASVLPRLGEDRHSEALGINDEGQIVGWSTVSAEFSVRHAVLWTTTPPPSGPSTLTFQKGGAGPFSETDDTYLSSALPDANFGAHAALYVDASGCTSSAGSVCKTLIRFPDFIGTNAGQVALGSVVVSATLQLEIANAGGMQFLYQLTEGWTESGATWNGFATSGSPGIKGSGVSFNAALGVISIDITAIVQNWVNGDANHGLLIWSTSTDGADYRSSESTNPPKLIVTVRSP